MVKVNKVDNCEPASVASVYGLQKVRKQFCSTKTFLATAKKCFTDYNGSGQLFQGAAFRYWLR